MALAVFLSGYTAQHYKQQREVKERFSQTIPICLSKEDCQLKLDAAQFCFVKNLRIKLQTTTNVIIQT